MKFSSRILNKDGKKVFSGKWNGCRKSVSRKIIITEKFSQYAAKTAKFRYKHIIIVLLSSDVLNLFWNFYTISYKPGPLRPSIKFQV